MTFRDGLVRVKLYTEPSAGSKFLLEASITHMQLYWGQPGGRVMFADKPFEIVNRYAIADSRGRAWVLEVKNIPPIPKGNMRSTRNWRAYKGLYGKR